MVGGLGVQRACQKLCTLCKEALFRQVWATEGTRRRGCLVPEKQQAVGPWRISQIDAAFTRARKAMARRLVRGGEHY